MRLALGVTYRGSGYHGWQSQAGVRSVQQVLEAALSSFAAMPVRVVCAGRTDTGVHGINQVVHLDTPLDRAEFSWVRGSNRFLPSDVAVQWCRRVEDDFHARYAARSRRYAYLLRESPTRPALEAGLAGWVFRPLDGERMRQAAAQLIGEHDFSSFRSADCQARSSVKLMHRVEVLRHGAYWRFDFEASAFLHHMVRNLMGCLVAVGAGQREPGWMAEVLAARNRDAAAPTFAPDGLYFLGPRYDSRHDLPDWAAAADWLPGAARPMP
ncbi:MAG TPA: tRNA pseudouridine(38-40) synthase TruA [Burkholderiaceae bacterium]|nr:tRNA pseudouridine(38-40) synthase TruA [Burkholderiaceae bacterium]HMX11678.1 tRNA pseudouridine(38-40) synthase TruA [Burkholderiaceae bacterium]HMZ01345.1 tRNA pseudouridine(38-40) synthase TruA [Burkholderiaceae bacterium]HNB46665.1 tRNA pseudouridine(38-40) synthase TruA [Burkholderiaceae bacterium]HNG79382.1 tRNA pseudouridine(38-40) synthase TruA [Burkholderiaceae bacterium]